MFRRTLQLRFTCTWFVRLKDHNQSNNFQRVWDSSLHKRKLQGQRVFLGREREKQNTLTLSYRWTRSVNRCLTTGKATAGEEIVNLEPQPNSLATLLWQVHTCTIQPRWKASVSPPLYGGGRWEATDWGQLQLNCKAKLGVNLKGRRFYHWHVSVTHRRVEEVPKAQGHSVEVFIFYMQSC